MWLLVLADTHEHTKSHARARTHTHTHLMTGVRGFARIYTHKDTHTHTHTHVCSNDALIRRVMMLDTACVWRLSLLQRQRLQMTAV